MGEMQFHVTAVLALEGSGDVAFIRQTAAFAERRLDEADFLPAVGADETFGGVGAFMGTDLAILGVNKTESGFEPLFENGAHGECDLDLSGNKRSKMKNTIER